MHQTQRMDLCRLGPVARMVVPPTCVVSMERGGYEAPPASPGPAGTESETSSPHSASMSGGINRMILPFDKDALATDVFERTTSWTSRAMKAGKAAGRQARQQAKEVLEARTLC